MNSNELSDKPDLALFNLVPFDLGGQRRLTLQLPILQLAEQRCMYSRVAAKGNSPVREGRVYGTPRPLSRGPKGPLLSAEDRVGGSSDLGYQVMKSTAPGLTGLMYALLPVWLPIIAPRARGRMVRD